MSAVDTGYELIYKDSVLFL